MSASAKSGGGLPRIALCSTRLQMLRSVQAADDAGPALASGLLPAYLANESTRDREPMTSSMSLIDRAGLNRTLVGQHLARGLDGADDGELFLEYRQSEALVFDNGRLKQATYDTAQGFGLRAVKGEAVGYAHASDVSEEAIERAVGAVRAVQGGYSGSYSQAPARTNVKLYGDENPLGTPSFETKIKLLEEIDAYARAKDPRVRQVSVSFGASWQVVEILRADGETYHDVRPLVRVNVSVVAGGRG